MPIFVISEFVIRGFECSNNNDNNNNNNETTTTITTTTNNKKNRLCSVNVNFEVA